MTDTFLEAQVVEGLEEIAANELRRFFSSDPKCGEPELIVGRGSTRFSLPGLPGWLKDLKTSAAVYYGQRFDIPRPKALLGDENFRLLLDQINLALSFSGRESFQSFYLSASGRDSSLLLRMRSQIAEAIGLPEGDRQGELLVRLRNADGASGGWEALVRLTPRPLSTRAWRVCNFEGSLNATVAHSMALLTNPSAGDFVLNLGCGSGSLLIERLAAGEVRLISGCDLSQTALSCCVRNLHAAGLAGSAHLILGDGRQLPYPDNFFDSVLADLPFGQRVGSHPANRLLYPALMAEAARVLRPGGKVAVLTHEVRLFHSLMANSKEWFLQRIVRVNLRGLHPRIFVLVRKVG